MSSFCCEEFWRVITAISKDGGLSACAFIGIWSRALSGFKNTGARSKDAGGFVVHGFTRVRKGKLRKSWQSVKFLICTEVDEALLRLAPILIKLLWQKQERKQPLVWNKNFKFPLLGLRLDLQFLHTMLILHNQEFGWVMNWTKKPSCLIQKL